MHPTKSDWLHLRITPAVKQALQARATAEERKVSDVAFRLLRDALIPNSIVSQISRDASVNVEGQQAEN